MKQQIRKQGCQISNTNSYSALEIIGVFRKLTVFIKRKILKILLQIQAKNISLLSCKAA